MSLRSPLGRVLGHGSAGDGAGHWWSQRVTAVALAPLGLWFLFALLSLPDFGHATVTAWIARPFTAVLLALFVATLGYHSALGVQVVVEDYIHGKGAKIAALLIVKYVHVVAVAAGVFAVLSVAFGARA
jgi:succinate dehydrogenase / fumarate reductase, membrane anchor subunit